MTRIISVLTVGLLFSFISHAQSGKVYDALSVPSKILKMERKYAIYLPPDYETSERSYPVLYLLHGSGDDQTGWIQFGELSRITDQAIRNGKATAMIIVMPDANTKVKGYFNQVDGSWNYESFFFKEFMPYIENTYRCKNEKRFRAIAGLSMGGGGTLIYALHHPELFSSACPLSASIGPLSLAAFKAQLKKQQTNFNENTILTYYEQHNALSLIHKMDKKDISSVRWYIDCGDDDFLYEGNSLIHIALRKREIYHEFRIRDGSHTWTYWRSSLPEVLSFVSDAFHQY